MDPRLPMALGRHQDSASGGMKMTPQLAEQMKSACFLIVDTNAWITALDPVLSLRRHHPRLTVIVPSAVVQELDGLKRAQEEEADGQSQPQRGLGFRARAAIKAIYDATTGAEPWVRGQRYDEHLGPAFKTENRDDEILSCALFFHSRVSPSALITGDYGLALKSTINGVPTTDMRGLLDSLSAFNHDNDANTRSTPPTSSDQGAFKRKSPDDGSGPNKRRRTSSDAVDIPGFCFTGVPSDGEEDSVPEAAVEPSETAPCGSLLLSLPLELQIKVMSFLPPRALLQVSLVASDLHRLLTAQGQFSDAIWADALRRSHGVRAFGSARSPKQWYLNWRRSVVPPCDLKLQS